MYPGDSTIEVPGARDTLRVTISARKGRPKLSIRWWYWCDKTKRLQPGKAGVAVDMGCLPELMVALQKVLDQAQRDGAFVLKDGSNFELVSHGQPLEWNPERLPFDF